MKKGNLRNILTALVAECGYDSVRECVNDLRIPESRKIDSQIPRTSEFGKARSKIGAVDVVESLDISNQEKKCALMTLAKKYEEKQFMPNMGHVRAFMEQEGCASHRIRSRQQATSAVFKRLALWDARDLQELDEKGIFGPPKTLAAIARSIENAGRRNRA